LLLNINKDVLLQFENRFGVATDGVITLKPEDGKGKISAVEFPGEVSLYRFTFDLHKSFFMESYNPNNSEWYLLNVNLSHASVRKEVNGGAMNLQRYLPAGVLFYTPGIRVKSQTPPNQFFEVALIRFHRNFLSHYFDDMPDLLSQLRETVIYEDLDPVSEVKLQDALSGNKSVINRHAAMLTFLGRFLEKIRQRGTGVKSKGVHPEDMKRLFLAAALLRNPVPASLPGINQLATTAGMSPTKFKLIFRQVFGAPPMRYHQKIRMEYARAELVAGKQSASEISYALGYSHPSKFTSAFKKQFGVLPSEL